ncbi:DNA mismatch repair protein MutS2 [Bacillus chungangensis]|uniref:Endonuclease MutS2 n=1 Tax=Bacillus chungangensis TaxID=587633 RepID=A0ABT9WMT5_9BACI|nr:DNA mismatch repair protein MutS2 [Bacillus chungangensis]
MLKTLEFDKIKEQLKQYTTSTLGADKVQALQPSASFEDAVHWQAETDEAAHVIRLKGTAPLSGIFDIRAHIKRSLIGGVLNPNELNEISSTLRTSRTMKRFIERLLEAEATLPILQKKAEQLASLSSLEQQIMNAIHENCEVSDHASDALRQIRQQLRTSEARVREKLESFMRGKNAQKMLSDAIITIRNDRYVIPVKQEYRAHYGGIIHDQSSSGQTLFIEPQAVVDLNNQLRAYHLKEREEIERILIVLSGYVAESADDLLLIVETLGSLDFIFAKARYGKALKASKPIMNNKGVIRLNKARHPLLPIDKAVANDMMLGDEFTTLVITGPNTGGKTITLKTLGLCTLMAQAGLQIPALDGSELAVFKQVFADIGDEQSIEQSLSTFSSHMVTIVDILQAVDHESLVLFDELGAGTDPQEGAALAIAILDEVHQRGARIIATTHYPELKAYGYHREGVTNASVEFDVETLSPTYKLLIGVPGRSNAFEISKRLGLGETVIERAKAHIGIKSNEVDQLIASLEKNKRSAEREFADARAFRKQAEQLHKDLQQKMQQFYEHEEALLAKAKQKAASVIENAKVEADDIIRELRKMQIEKRVNVKEHELIDAKHRLNEAVPDYHLKKTVIRQPAKQRVLQPGDEVKVSTLDQKGQLLEKVGSDEWQVQIGMMKVKVKESDLSFLQTERKLEPKPLTTVKGKNYHVNLELDLRGERYEDAILRVEKYIDDALLAGYPRVSIIHGKGTGALRQGVHEYLKKHRAVKRTRLGEAGEGGSGVTVVEFK